MHHMDAALKYSTVTRPFQPAGPVLSSLPTQHKQEHELLLFGDFSEKNILSKKSTELQAWGLSGSLAGNLEGCCAWNAPGQLCGWDSI